MNLQAPAILTKSTDMLRLVLLSQAIHRIASASVTLQSFSSTTILFLQNANMTAQASDDIHGLRVFRPLLSSLMHHLVTLYFHMSWRQPTKPFAVYSDLMIRLIPLISNFMMKWKQGDTLSFLTASAFTRDHSSHSPPLLHSPVPLASPESSPSFQDDVSKVLSEVDWESYCQALDQRYSEVVAILPFKPPYRTGLQDLPAETIHEICDYLGQEDLSNFRCSSKFPLNKGSSKAISCFTRAHSFCYFSSYILSFCPEEEL